MATADRPMQKTLFGGAEPAKAVPGSFRSTPANGYAAAPGSGPSGESCGSCRHCSVRSARGSKARNFYKCDLMAQHWTYGRGSDVLLHSPACSRWEAGKPHTTTVSRVRHREWED